MSVVTAEEGWELWVCEGEQRLMLVFRVSIDDAIRAWRSGNDPILQALDTVSTRLQSGELTLPG